MSAGLLSPENMGFKVVADGEVFTFAFSIFTFAFSIGTLVEACAPGNWCGVEGVENFGGLHPRDLHLHGGGWLG